MGATRRRLLLPAVLFLQLLRAREMRIAIEELQASQCDTDGSVLVSAASWPNVAISKSYQDGIWLSAVISDVASSPRIMLLAHREVLQRFESILDAAASAEVFDSG